MIYQFCPKFLFIIQTEFQINFKVNMISLARLDHPLSVKVISQILKWLLWRKMHLN